jgi:hypothetical protein
MGWVWVDRPKPCGMTGLGRLDVASIWRWVWIGRPNPCGMMAFGRLGPTLHMLVGLGRPTQTFRNLRLIMRQNSI